MDEIEFPPTFKIWLGVNHLPVIEGNGHAIWRRMRIVPFIHRVESPDLELGRRLHAELPGILAWAIRGCARWQAEGLGTCAAVERATDAYRREQDQVARFVDERCKRDPTARTRNSAIYDAYCTWANANDLPVKGNQELGKALPARAPSNPQVARFESCPGCSRGGRSGRRTLTSGAHPDPAP